MRVRVCLDKYIDTGIYGYECWYQISDVVSGKISSTFVLSYFEILGHQEKMTLKRNYNVI